MTRIPTPRCIVPLGEGDVCGLLDTDSPRSCHLKQRGGGAEETEAVPRLLCSARVLT